MRTAALIAGLLLALPACDTARVDPCGSAGCDDQGGGDSGDANVGDSKPGSPDRGQSQDVLTSCPPGRTPCGLKCCTSDQLCISNACANLGPKCDELWPCPTGYYCDKVKGRCIPGGKKCEYRPPVGVFSPKVKWEWTGSKIMPMHNQVMMAPMVANLTDDNKDGKIDRKDVPDIVFNTFSSSYWHKGVLRAISGDGKQEHWAVTSAAHATTPGAGVALGDIDNDGKPEVVTCAESLTTSTPGGVIAFEHDGKFKWRNTDPKVPCGFAAPSIADLDGDGKPEVVVRYAALAGATGKTRWVGRAATGAYSAADYTTVADVNEDGKPEVVGGNVVFSHAGKVLWEHKSRPDGYAAVADLDGDGKPEIVTASTTDHSLRAYHHDGKKYWGPAEINPSGKTIAGGGPPTIADFDGDGRPEVATAGGYGYVVFEHDGKRKWYKPTQDLSSRVTGSSVFDFEGDGKAEAVYSDELVLRIYQGSSGKVLFSHCNTSGTLWEYPLIVDVDNDGHAEIVVANNNYTFSKCADSSASHTGIKVLADTKHNWVRTRRIWNQHTYHVTNIDEDGRVPKVEARNWDNPNLNNFRQNVQPGGLFDAPDLLGDAGKATCAATINATVKVKNDGAAKVAPGIPVTLYGELAGKGAAALQTALTKTTIYPGQSELVSFSVATPGQFVKQQVTLTARVDDDGKGGGKANECREGNNKVSLGSVLCKVIN